MPQEVARLEFGIAAALPKESMFRLTASHGGRCNAVAWWFDLELYEDIILSAAPGCSLRTWKQNIQYLDVPLVLKRGDQVELKLLNHEDDQLHIECVRHITDGRM